MQCRCSTIWIEMLRSTLRGKNVMFRQLAPGRTVPIHHLRSKAAPPLVEGPCGPRPPACWSGWLTGCRSHPPAVRTSGRSADPGHPGRDPARLPIAHAASGGRRELPSIPGPSWPPSPTPRALRHQHGHVVGGRHRQRPVSARRGGGQGCRCVERVHLRKANLPIGTRTAWQAST